MSGFQFEGVDDDFFVDKQEVVEKPAGPPTDSANPALKYYLPDSESDNDENEEHQVLSAEERALQDMQRDSDQLDLLLGSNWSTCLDLFESFVKKAAAYQRKGTASERPVPELVRETLRMVGEVLQGYADTSKTEFEGGPSEYKCMQRLVKSFKAAEERFPVVEEKKMESPKIKTDESPLFQFIQRITTVVGNSKLESVREYESLLNTAKEFNQPFILIYLYGTLAHFQLSTCQRLKHVEPSTWKTILRHIRECFSLIQKNPDMTVSAYRGSGALVLDVKNMKGTVILGGLVSLYKNLFEEMRRLCQNLTKNYIQCIECECLAVDLGYDLLDYFGKKKDAGVVADCLLQCLSTRTERVHQALNQKFGHARPLDCARLWHLCEATLAPQRRSTAFLNYCYFLILEGKALQCRELLIKEKTTCLHKIFKKGNVYELDDNTSVENGILINRLIVQLGMDAFQRGKLTDCSDLLREMIEDGSWTVLIGQQLPHTHGLSATDQAKTELMMSSVLIPVHQHISTQRVEVAYLLAASIDRVVANAKAPFARVNRFQTSLDRFLRRSAQAIAGPPQSEREHVYHLYLAMQNGDCQAALEHLNALVLWKDFEKGDEVRCRLQEKIQEATLLVFLFGEATNFETITLDFICDRFGLDRTAARKIINRNLLDKESTLVAFWTDDDQVITVERSNATRLHHIVEGTAQNTFSLEIPSQPFVQGDRRRFRRY